MDSQTFSFLATGNIEEAFVCHFMSPGMLPSSDQCDQLVELAFQSRRSPLKVSDSRSQIMRRWSRDNG